MLKAWIMGATALFGAASFPAAVSACTVILREAERTPAAERARAIAAVDRAIVIVDAEVVRPYVPGRQTALLKAFKVHKGPAQETYKVDAPTSCNREFDRTGERVRVLLGGGPDVYFDIDDAGVRQIDSLLKSDRRKDWPHVAGE